MLTKWWRLSDEDTHTTLSVWLVPEQMGRSDRQQSDHSE